MNLTKIIMKLNTIHYLTDWEDNFVESICKRVKYFDDPKKALSQKQIEILEKIYVKYH